jgi:hypothetical protein
MSFLGKLLSRKYWKTTASVEEPRYDREVPYLNLTLENTLCRQADAPFDGLIPISMPEPVGRSGTTLLMQLLASSPQVALQRKYPLESRYLTYLVHWAQLLGQSASPSADWNAMTIFQEQLDSIRPFPDGDAPLFCTPAGTLPLWANCFLACWSEFSRVAVSATQRNLSSDRPVIYYAEKTPSWCYRTIAQIMPVKGLYALRDPRDVLISAMQFDKKRRTPGALGPQWNFDDPAQLVEFEATAMPMMRSRLRRILSAKDSNKEGADILVVRYEDLVLDLAGETKRIGHWLNLELSLGETLSSSKQYLLQHQTSENLRASIERWKRELPIHVNDLFVEHLGTELLSLGYTLR